MPDAPVVLLTIAGFDPSSGAGITADIKTFSAHQCYGVACITALTVQSTRGVRRVQPLSATVVSETLEELADDFPIAAVKIGMLGSAAVARAVLRFLESRRPEHVVLDPVLRSSSGAALLDPAGISALRKMLSFVEVITPNVSEAAVLARTRVRMAADISRASMRLHALGARNVVITGGDFQQDRAEAKDFFSGDNGADFQQISGPRASSSSTHGTGCAFASAIAANLAHGVALQTAVITAKQYVGQAIRTAAAIGHGHGPLNHFVK